jgi:hypothetical protein
VRRLAKTFTMVFPSGAPETSHLLQWGSFLLDDSGHE